ncbi:STAS domain-containing protein [Streptomyces cyanogenus]|uniref:Anti-sigma factor antagonist n=1 Tax=Streptomyces cyanogenus TaxID=80860 RepID=A0ABX7U076_STRCY|nr:STAS domain-containing protein [Streptomyces cyanogenus]QTE02426.1 Anti-sigma-B factor antagonist [Streptomyces cyanogenus]
MVETLIRPGGTHRVRAVGGTSVVELYGEIDILTAPSVMSCLDDLTACARPDLVVDLRAVSFIDCAGLGLLCRARSRVRERGGRLRLVSGSLRLLRIMNAVGLGDAFEICDRLPEAVSAAPGKALCPAGG